MSTTNNTVPLALTAVADTTFNTASQYTLYTGLPAPFTAALLDGITFSVDRLTVNVSGIYNIQSYSNISAFPSSSARISTRFLINGTTYGSRKPIIKSAVVSDESQLTGFGLIQLNAGDYIQITYASDTTGNLLIKDSSHILTLIKPI